MEHPWSMTFLPDGRILVSERPGRLASHRTVACSPVSGFNVIRCKVVRDRRPAAHLQGLHSTPAPGIRADGTGAY
ncbi:MAG: PQQ-dependent sugar dehydrogenase [Chromatiales bacterium]